MTRALNPDALRHVRTFDDVLDLLRDDLDWPIGANDLDDVAYDWSAEELGIDPARAPQLRHIRQLQPLTVGQPWGIFFLDFAGPRLPITPLRRLLQALVTAKRAGAKGHATWGLEDLLFVITTDTGDTVELHLVAFFPSDDGRVEIRSLPWRPDESPDLHLQRLAGELLPCLAWPANTDNTDAWRNLWRNAFRLRHGEVIQSAATLAQRMAEIAIDLYNQVVDALEADTESPFRALQKAVRTELVADVDDERFADMCAQTLVYGTLTARITDPIGFGASPNIAVVPLANPFLAAFFEQIHDQIVDLYHDDSPLEQLVADLRTTNVEAILDQFGNTAKGGDPVIHFYEEFLKRYDSKMRADAGAFYTPQPVVHFMVRAVDEALKTIFGMPEGLSDRSTWKAVCDHLDTTVPKGIDGRLPFLSMLDPATGTGTYLVEWLRRARTSFLDANPGGDWVQRLETFVAPSMHAFELMLAPYAIAHLKVALETHSEGSENADIAIHLTDTLEHPQAHGTLALLDDPVSLEGQRAAALKENERFTVIVGNPPYDREQRSASATGKRKGGVVRYGVPKSIDPLLNDVIKFMRDAGLGVHTKNLYNDYVYFWRWATWQTTERIPGPGVSAFITASSFLDGISMGGLRAHLRQRFDRLYIIDLGGDNRGALKEPNVFDIQTPVAIAIGIRSSGRPECEVRYTRVQGSRAEKYQVLSNATLGTLTWTDVPGATLDPLVPRKASPYRAWPAVTDLFPWSHSGCQFKRTWPIAPSESILQRRWSALHDLNGEERARAFKETRDRKLASRLTSLSDAGAVLQDLSRPGPYERLVRYGYRSFDRQYCIADNRVADFPRPVLWRSMSAAQVFLTTLTATRLGQGPVVVATPHVPDLSHFRGSFGAKDTIPLFRDRKGQDANITSNLLTTLGKALDRVIDAEDLLAYVYALTATSAFAARFSDELSEAAGPVRIPITANGATFSRVVDLGRELLWWHTWGERFEPDDGRELPAGPSAEIDPVRGYPAKFSYDAASELLAVGTGRFGPVSGAVWEFEVSGLKALQSWLGNRMAAGKGKKSSPLDEIRPERWTFTEELLTLLAILHRTVELTPQAAELLEAVVSGPLIDPATLPVPRDGERKAPLR